MANRNELNQTKANITEVTDNVLLALDDIKESIVESGIEVPEGTPIDEYGNKIDMIYESGSEDGYEKGKTDFGYKKSVSGSYLYIDDINPEEKAIPTVVTSENLFNINGNLSDSVGYITGTTILEDGKIKATANFYSGAGQGQFIEALPNTQYTLQYEICDMEVSGNTVICIYSVNSNNKQTIISHTYVNAIKKYNHLFTTLDDTKYIWLSFGGINGQDGKYVIYDKVQLERGNVATDYTPFVDVANSKLTVCGENIFNPSNLLYQHDLYAWAEKDGIYSGCSHGLFLKCQNDETALVSDCFLPNTQYIFTFKGWVNPNADGVYRGIAFLFYYTDGTRSATKIISTENEAEYTLISAEGKTVKRIYVDGYYNNVINYIKEPQLSVYIPDADMSYEPYNATEYTPNTDGVLSVTPYYPITNMFTDNTGVTINAEYYADSEKIIGELTDTIISLGGTLDV